MAAFTLQWWGRYCDETKTFWSTKPSLFTIWSFVEKVCWVCWVLNRIQWYVKPFLILWMWRIPKEIGFVWSVEEGSYERWLPVGPWRKLWLGLAEGPFHMSTWANSEGIMSVLFGCSVHTHFSIHSFICSFIHSFFMPPGYHWPM